MMPTFAFNELIKRSKWLPYPCVLSYSDKDVYMFSLGQNLVNRQFVNSLLKMVLNFDKGNNKGT